MMRRSKAMLAGHWGQAVVATLIVMVLMCAASATYIGELIVYGPLIFGYTLYIMCLYDTKTSDLNLLFKGFSERFVDTLVFGLLYSLAVGVGFMLLIVPGVILSLGFAMTPFIMADNPKISAVDAMQESWNMMSGHRWDLFCLWFRFIGWALLCLLTCGIGWLWLYPYMTGATLCYYRQLRYGSF